VSTLGIGMNWNLTSMCFSVAGKWEFMVLSPDLGTMHSLSSYKEGKSQSSLLVRMTSDLESHS